MGDETITFDLAMSVEEALGRIASMMDDYKLFEQFRYTGEKEFMGQVSGNRFFVYRKMQGYNSYRPRLSGVVTETPNGCHIGARIGTLPFVSFFTVFWFASVTLFFAFSIVMLVFHAASMNPVVLSAFLLPLGMLFFGGGVVFAASKSAEHNTAKLETAFLDLFNDCRNPDGSLPGRVLWPTEDGVEKGPAALRMKH